LAASGGPGWLIKPHTSLLMDAIVSGEEVLKQIQDVGGGSKPLAKMVDRTPPTSRLSHSFPV
jgi:hypothetical protein